eukprot:TCALIF_07856-PA protein Name:"Similar to CG12034 Putative neutral sphingomyelinase (Drosophila melanogaster)" AED:0.16 eAED:0.16 QI:19/0.5/0/1/1/0.66/3/0/254
MTLNCWAIGYVPVLKSPDRGIRIEAIAQHLKTCGDQYDVVCLQELWLQSDRTKIVERSIETFPHSKEFQGGLIGTGLLLLSKYPLQDPSYKLFSMNGYLHQIWYGDSWCGSGIGTAWIELPNGFKVLICTSHFHAEYNRYSDHEGVWAQIKFQDQKDIAYDKPEAYDVDTLNRLNSQLRDVLRLERSKMEWSMWIIFMVSAAFLSVWKWEGPWSIFIVLILSYLFYLGGQFFKRITAISSQIDTIMALMNPVKK